jgi:hypothetical protein
MTLYTGIARSHCQGVRAQKSLKHNIFSETLLAFFYNGLSRRQEKNSVRKKTHLAACTYRVCRSAHEIAHELCQGLSQCTRPARPSLAALPLIEHHSQKTLSLSLSAFPKSKSPLLRDSFLRTLSPSRPEAVTRQGVVLTDLQSLIDCQ